MNDMKAGPLSGVRVIDCTTVIAGPLCTQLLADQGADVIKIEPTSGDLIRNLGPMLSAGFSSTFLALGRNKRSLALDLSSSEAQEIMQALCADADVFIGNSRPGVMAKHGLSYETLSANNKKLVYVAITGFGNEGPMSEQRAYDPIIQALAGVASLQKGNALVSHTICDKTTGLYASQAVTAALVGASRTGQGQLVEVSMLDATLSFLACDALWPIATEKDLPYPEFSKIYIPWPSQDGHVVLVILADKEFMALCQEFHCSELLNDSRFNSMGGRLLNWPSLVKLITPILIQFTTEELLRRLWQADVPAAPINNIEQLPDNPQIKATNMLNTVNHPVAGEHLEVSMAAKFSRQDAVIKPASSLGEDGPEILSEAGFNQVQIDKFLFKK